MDDWTSCLQFLAYAGSVYLFQITSYDGDAGNIHVMVTNRLTPPGNDFFARYVMALRSQVETFCRCCCSVSVAFAPIDTTRAAES